MNDKKIKMVALDLDGTTLNDRGKITERTMEAFKKAMNRGTHIVISTGRTFQSLPKQLFSIEGLEYVVTSNGAHITKIADLERIYEDHIGSSAVEQIADLLQEGEMSLEVFVDGHAYIDREEYDSYAEYGSNYRDVNYILTTRNPIPDILGFMRENREQIENISLNFEFMDEREQWYRKLSEIKGITLTTSFTHNIEIGGEHTSKAQALRFLMEKLGICSDELLACGDSPNDLEMIKLAGIGVVMGNASESMKKHADFVTAANNDDGVARVIEKFVL